MDYIYGSPEDYLLDDAANDIEDAEEDVLYNDSKDIDRVGDITDEDIEASDYDPEDDLEDYIDSDYHDDYNDDVIEYEVPANTQDDEIEDEEEIDDVATIEKIVDEEEETDYE